MSDDLALVADADGVRTITMNRPERRNALNTPLLEALRAAFAGAAADESVRSVVLAGAGKGFCAGADVSDWAAYGDADVAADAGATWERNAHELVQEVHELPKPTVAVLNGAAVGAGLDLACACDFRVAADDAVFFCAYTWVGYNPDVGGSWLYPRLMGLEAAKRFVYTGERWDAAKAKSHGLVSEVVARDDLAATGAALAAELATGPSVAIGLAKGLLQTASTRTLGEQLAAEKAAGQICAKTADHREALAAFSEKRSPVFRGR
jgi:2-(1,2-epoxy-1,2-dihydrophenyl)acetyl-CoA isomerase